MSEELKHCPFCGSDDVSFSEGRWKENQIFHYVECGKCASMGPSEDEKKDAMEGWNKRA